MNSPLFILHIIIFSHVVSPAASLRASVRTESAGVIALAVGGKHTCGLLTGGGAYCWGYNGDGQLGTGDTNDRHTLTAVTGLGSGGTRLVLQSCYHLS